MSLVAPNNIGDAIKTHRSLYLKGSIRNMLHQDPFREQYHHERLKGKQPA
jgi:hypothetical protein